jgi:hypothetical protein
VAFTLCYLGLCRVRGLLRSSRRTETDKDIEIMVLRHQVRILKRQLNARVAYRPVDRAILVALSRLLPRWLLPSQGDPGVVHLLSISTRVIRPLNACLEW